MSSLVSIPFPELAGFPLRQGIFPKQYDATGGPVAASHESVASNLGAESFCYLHQVHGTSVIPVTRRTPLRLPADGLYTSEANLSLHISHADCQAAIFYDPEQHVVANIHSGWRGLVGNIYAVTIATLKKVFHSSPKDLVVVIGPSIGPDHAVYPNYETLFPPSFLAAMPKKYHLDFRSIAHKQILETGVKKNNLFISTECTYCCHEKFFSSRYRQNFPSSSPRKQNNITAAMLLARD